MIYKRRFVYYAARDRCMHNPFLQSANYKKMFAVIVLAKIKRLTLLNGNIKVKGCDMNVNESILHTLHQRPNGIGGKQL